MEKTVVIPRSVPRETYMIYGEASVREVVRGLRRAGIIFRMTAPKWSDSKAGVCVYGDQVVQNKAVRIIFAWKSR